MRGGARSAQLHGERGGRTGGRLAVIIAMLVAINIAVVVYHGDPRQKWRPGGLAPPPPPPRAAVGGPSPTATPPPPPRALSLGAPSGSRAPRQRLQLVLRAGQSAGEALAAAGARAADIQAASDSLAELVDFRRLLPGDTVIVDFADDGAMAALELHRGGQLQARAWRGADGWRGERLPERLDAHSTAVQGRVETNLVEALLAQREGAELAQVVGDIFAGEINLATDLGAGDSFRLLVDKHYRAGRFAGYGPLRVAELALGGRRLRAFLFVDDEGESLHYDADGWALARPLLRLPLAALTAGSGFGSRRHPLLGIHRHHNGIDYPMPQGTAVWAAGDGMVVRAGWSGDFGRLIEIQHAEGWLSQYAHLSRIDVHLGQQVRQRQVVGAVGQTGLATGPHLHFALKQHGHFVDVRLPSSTARARIAPVETRRFAATVALGLAWLERLPQQPAAPARLSRR